MSLNDSLFMTSSTQLLFTRRSSKVFFVISAYFWLPQAFFADCNHIDISNLRWLHDTSELEMTFQSKPEKIYELQGSSDLSEFDAIFDVAVPYVSIAPLVKSTALHDPAHPSAILIIPLDDIL